MLKKILLNDFHECFRILISDYAIMGLVIDSRLLKVLWTIGWSDFEKGSLFKRFCSLTITQRDNLTLCNQINTTKICRRVFCNNIEGIPQKMSIYVSYMVFWPFRILLLMFKKLSKQWQTEVADVSYIKTIIILKTLLS